VPATPTKITYFATDSVERFRRLGQLFMEQPLADVIHIDLGG
jgi:hypothetical protein